MKQKQNISIQSNISTFDFILLPQSLIINMDKIQGKYCLQLEKGLQKIHKINEDIIFKRFNQYTFQSKQTFKIKVYKEKSMGLAWSLYKIVGDSMEFVDIIKFSLQDYYNSYLKELKSYSFEYSRILQQRGANQPLGNTWKNLKIHMRQYKFNLSLTNSTNTIVFKCSLQLKNQYDYITEKEEAKQSKISKKSSNESQGRSTTSRKSLYEKRKTILQKQIFSKIQTPKSNGLEHSASAIQLHAYNQSKKEESVIISPKKGQKIEQQSQLSPEIVKKQQSYLSEIVEASLQQSASFGIKDNNFYPSFLDHIPKSIQISPSKKIDESQQQNDFRNEILKRNHSFQIPPNHEFTGEIIIQENSQEKINIEVGNIDIETKASSLLKNQQSNIYTIDKPLQSIESIEKPITLKFILVTLLLFLIIVGGSVLVTHKFKSLININKSPKNKVERKKKKMNKQ